MRIFISWSGDESRATAQVFHNWIQSTLQSVKPYFSPSDIEKGARWASEIAGELSQCSVAVIILTQSNLDSNWIMFEAGAISKIVGTAHVCPILIGVEPTDIKGPLAQFQATKFEKEDIKKLFLTINSLLGDTRLADQVAAAVFEKWWPDLQKEILASLSKYAEVSKLKTSVRSERDLLEEILTTIRNISREQPGVPAVNSLNSATYLTSSQKILLGLIDRFLDQVLFTDAEGANMLAALKKAEAEIKAHKRLSQDYKAAIVSDLKALRDKVTASTIAFEKPPGSEDSQAD